MFCPEQILHHMIVEPFKPVLLNGLYEQVYGCLPPSVKVDKNGKTTTKKYGPHAAIHQLRKWIQVNSKIYVCETDIHHAYGSVHIATLIKQMRRVIEDDEWLRLTCQFLHYKQNDSESEKLCGLILGHYTSPWFFNFYLKNFDHFAAQLDGVKYLRFADITPTFKIPINFEMFQAYTKFLKNIFGFIVDGVIIFFLSAKIRKKFIVHLKIFANI